MIHIPWLKLTIVSHLPFKIHCRLVEERRESAEMKKVLIEVIAEKSPNLATDMNLKKPKESRSWTKPK